MRYSLLGKTGLRVSALGFGCMRLPMKGHLVDRDRAIPLLRTAVEAGVNFFDTAVGYCNHDSENVLGEAMESIRNRVVLSTKNPHHTATPVHWRKTLEDSLRKLRTDRIDIYNHHGINWDTFVTYLDPDKGGLTKEMLKARDEKLIDHIGISFHDKPENLIKLVDTGYYESVILQYNLLDQANAEAMLYAHEKGLGVIVMGPVGGGRLGVPSERIAQLTGGAISSTVEAALRFVWGHPGVSIALSGMGSMEMLEQNAAIAEGTEPFSPDRIAALNGLVQERRRKSGLYCTACRYCMPVCPAQVHIPEQLDLLNSHLIYGLTTHAQDCYQTVGVKAAECIQCGTCAGECPQNIDIPARMREVVRLFDPRSGTVQAIPRVVRLSSDGQFMLGVHVRNYADERQSIAVGIESRNGAVFEQDRSGMEDLPSFGEATITFQGRFPPASDSIDFSTVIEHGGHSSRRDTAYRFILLEKGPAGDGRGEKWFQFAPSDTDFSQARETVPLHAARFKLSYDEKGLLLLVEVKDDFLFPSNPEKDKGKLTDNLELFLDGRAPARIGTGVYGAGVCQIALYPGTPGTYPAFCHTYSPGGGVELSELSAQRSRDGYVMRVGVPFSSFCVEPGIPPKIGFDLAVNTADSQGHRIAQYVFAGDGDNHRNAANFREVWLQ